MFISIHCYWALVLEKHQFSFEISLRDSGFISLDEDGDEARTTVFWTYYSTYDERLKEQYNNQSNAIQLFLMMKTIYIKPDRVFNKLGS